MIVALFVQWTTWIAPSLVWPSGRTGNGAYSSQKVELYVQTIRNRVSAHFSSLSLWRNIVTTDGNNVDQLFQSSNTLYTCSHEGAAGNIVRTTQCLHKTLHFCVRKYSIALQHIHLPRGGERTDANRVGQESRAALEVL